MQPQPPSAGEPKRVSSGVVGLDTITRGGLFKAGIYVVVGRPGSGKTTLANQACFAHVKQGGRALYVTLLSETHGRMLAQMQGMSFFDEKAVGGALVYVNGFSSLETDGLAGLLKLLRATVREHKADLLVLDGIVTASALARSNVDYKKFINELQTWVSVIGCTVFFLTSGGTDVSIEPEYTMVDGILELRTKSAGLRRLRQLFVRKFRGSGYLEGGHPYEITDDGMVVYPRVEAQLDSFPAETAVGGVIASGVPGLDRLFGGGIPRGSSTVLLGPSGAGKTTAGLQFLNAGLANGENALFFGFCEPPVEIRRQAERFRMPFDRWSGEGRLHLLWHPPAERILDALAYELILAVRARDVRRLFIDGLVGLKACAYAERLPGFLAVLSQELRALGVTMMMTEEGRRLLLPGLSSPQAFSALFDNIVRLERRRRGGRTERLATVAKARQVSHDTCTYRFEIGETGLVIGAPDTGPTEAPQ